MRWVREMGARDGAASRALCLLYGYDEASDVHERVYTLAFLRYGFLYPPEIAWQLMPSVSFLPSLRYTCLKRNAAGAS